MKTGFSFKGIHSNRFGITAATKNRPILPEVKRVTFDPDALDGLIDVSARNELGRATYAERVFIINIYVSAENIYKLQHKMSKLASWLTGSGELVFDDIPGVVWDAAVVTTVDYMPEREGRKAVLAVSFNVKPFSRAVFGTTDSITIGSKIPIGAKIPIGLSDILAVEITSSNSQGGAVINAYNIGTAPTKPKIIISAEGIENTGELDHHSPYRVKVSNGSAFLTVTWVNGCRQCIIDMNRGRIELKDSTGNLQIPHEISGSLFELQQEANEISLDNIPTGATVAISYIPQFLYSWEVE